MPAISWKAFASVFDSYSCVVIVSETTLISMPWNGFAALAQTYNAFDPADKRRKIFLVGPQVNLETLQPAETRDHKPLDFSITIGNVTSELSADGRVSLPGTPYLAGSALTLDRAIANTVRFTGLPIDDVAPMASAIPASCLGMTTAGTVTAEWNPESGTLDVQRVSA